MGIPQMPNAAFATRLIRCDRPADPLPNMMFVLTRILIAQASLQLWGQKWCARQGRKWEADGGCCEDLPGTGVGQLVMEMKRLRGPTRSRSRLVGDGDGESVRAYQGQEQAGW